MSGKKTTLLFLVLQVAVLCVMVLNISVSVKSILTITELGEPYLRLRNHQFFNIGLSSAAMLLGLWNAYNLFNRLRGEHRSPGSLAEDAKPAGE